MSVLAVSLVAAVFGAFIVVPLMAHGVVSGVSTTMTGHPLKYWYPWKKRGLKAPQAWPSEMRSLVPGWFRCLLPIHLILY